MTKLSSATLQAAAVHPDRGGSHLIAIYRRCLALLSAFSLLVAAMPASAATILFVGNSFTFGATSAVHTFGRDRVTDLNGDGIGGVPALFKVFAEQAGLDWQVSLETSGGRDLAWHLANRRALIEQRWDAVVLQGYSTLDADRPGDGTRHVAAARALAALVRARNPAVKVSLVATWSRADQTYRPGGHWYGKPIETMARDLLVASRPALAPGRYVDTIVPVGDAWTRAMTTGLADPDPYDGIAFGRVSLWGWDQYHASAEGSYLSALMIFGSVTGHDPRRIGSGGDGVRAERAAFELGLDPRIAAGLRAVAAAQLGFAD